MRGWAKGEETAARYGYRFSTATSTKNDGGFGSSKDQPTLLPICSLKFCNTWFNFSLLDIFGCVLWPTCAVLHASLIKERKSNIDRNTDTTRTQDKQASLRQKKMLHGEHWLAVFW